MGPDLEFNDIFNRAEMPNPVTTNSSATQTANAAGMPTGGFWQVSTPAKIQTPTSRQGQVVARFTF
jgi:hypothetical protein